MDTPTTEESPMEHADLIPLVRRFFETDPNEAARALEAMQEQDAVAALETMPPALASRVFGSLHVGYAAGLARAASPALMGALIDRLDPQQGAAILIDLPEERRLEFLALLSDKQRATIQELLTFPAGSAGRVMSTDFLAFHAASRVSDAIGRIRALRHGKAPVSYTYVVDEDNRLIGVVNMRDLLLSEDDAPLREVMRPDVFSVGGFTDCEVVAQELAARKFFAAPVVDAEGHLLGVVKSDRLLSDVQKEASDDLQKLFGAGGDEGVASSLGLSLRKRLPWLHVNLVTAFLAGAVVGLFEDVIARITVLAVFLPVVAGQGGNAGAQALAVTLRGLVMREIPPGKAGRLLRKEMIIGTVNGLVVGLVTAAAAILWSGNPMLGVVVGAAMLVNLVSAGLSGASIPLAMRALGLDPAQSSNIILTTVTDVVGFAALLGLAVVLEPYLA